MDINDLAEGLYLEEYAKGQKKDLENRLKSKQLLLAYKSLMKTPDGKKVLWDILEFCGVFQNAMTGNSWTYFNLGKGSVGQYIMLALNIGNTFDDVLGFQKLMPEDKDG